MNKRHMSKDTTSTTSSDKLNHLKEQVLVYEGEDGKQLHLYVGDETVYCYLLDKDQNLIKTRTIKKCRSISYENSSLANSSYNASLLWKIQHGRNYFVTQGAGNLKLIYKNQKLLEEKFSKWIADTFKVDKC